MTTFRVNPSFELDLAADVETKAAMMTFKDAALDGARAAAPVRSGRYRDSLFADEDGLGSTSSFWALIEYGTVDTPPHSTLQRGVEAAGLLMTDASG